MRSRSAFYWTISGCGITASLVLAAIGPLSANDAITIGVEETASLPHYEFANGVYKGFAADLIEKFAQDSHYRIDYRPMPVIRLFGALMDGSIDLKYPDSPLWSAAAKAGREIQYSEPVVAYVDGVSVLPSHVGRGPDSIKILGTVLGFTAYEWQDRLAGKQATLQESRSFEILARMAQAGRIDGAYGNVAVLANTLNTQLATPGALVFDPSLPHGASHYHFSSLKRPTLITEMNQWMRANESWIASLKRAHGVGG